MVESPGSRVESQNKCYYCRTRCSTQMILSIATRPRNSHNNAELTLALDSPLWTLDSIGIQSRKPVRLPDPQSTHDRGGDAEHAHTLAGRCEGFRQRPGISQMARRQELRDGVSGEPAVART